MIQNPPTIKHADKKATKVVVGARNTPQPVVGKRPAPVTLRLASIRNGMNKISSAKPIMLSNMQPVVELQPSNLPNDTRAIVQADATVFDNNHAYAPAALETMIGKPFSELRRRSWLLVRPDIHDVQKLLQDTFRLRKSDNRRCNAGDKKKLSAGTKRKHIKCQWENFVGLCLSENLLPYKDDSDEATKLLLEPPVQFGGMDAAEVVKRYDDVRMPLQMRIFAEQVMGYPVEQAMSEEMWADLLKFEEWEWTGYGFEWKTIFGQAA